MCEICGGNHPTEVHKATVDQREVDREEEQEFYERAAKKYAASLEWKTRVEYWDASYKDIAELLKNPEKFKDKFELTHDDISDIKDWVVWTEDDEWMRKKHLVELRASQPDNPLFKESFEGVPEGYVSVYHFTGQSRVAKIGEGGLRPAKEMLSEEEDQQIKEEGWKRFEVDEIFDKAAPEGYSRTNAVYAHEDFRKTSERPMGGGGVVVEIKVDPKKVLVTDADAFSEAGDTNEFEKTYWEHAITLEKFRSLPEETQRSYFNFPEVVIPGTVKPEFMKVVAVENIPERP